MMIYDIWLYIIRCYLYIYMVTPLEPTSVQLICFIWSSPKRTTSTSNGTNWSASSHITQKGSLPMTRTHLLHLIFSHKDHFQCNPSFVPLLHEEKRKKKRKNKKKKKQRKKTKTPRSLIEWWPHTYFPACQTRFFCFFSVFSVWL